jgi:sugar phosphate isomerase/epimerase
MNFDQLGVQLYTLRDLTATDMPGTLRRVAEIGYRNVELAGWGNSNPREIRSTLDELGLRAPSAHIPIDRLEQNLDGVLDDLRTLGCEYAIVPWIGEELRGGAERGRDLAERLNRIGAALRGSDVRLAYHNHDFEFAADGDTTFWHTLAANTDPALMDFELDVYWVAVAGYDPSDLLQQFRDRVALVHLKDRSPGPNGTFAPVGSGTLAWRSILEAAENARWLIVEQDRSDDPLTDIRSSFDYLRSLA